MNKTHYIGFDLGIRAANPTGAALLDFATGEPVLVDVYTLAPPKLGDWQARVSSVAALARDVLRRHAGMLAGVGYELPWAGENPQTALRLADLGGAIRGCACSLGLPVWGLSPLEAKQALTGGARASKDAMQRAVFLQFRRAVSSHEADAVGVALSVRASMHRAKLAEGIRS